LTFSPGSTRTVDGLFACADQFRQQACDAVNDDVIPPCVTPGTRAPGEPCIASSQCASLVCFNTGGGNCGSCDPTVGVGEACSSEVACTPGLYCDPLTNTCATYQSSTMPDGGVPPNSGGPGDPCSTDESCSSATFCKETANPAVCTALPTLGEDCATPHRCAGDDYCDHEGFVCRGLPGMGQDCGVDAVTGVAQWCEPPLICRPLATSGNDTCEPAQTEGEPCLLDNTGNVRLDSCASDLACDTTRSPPTCVNAGTAGKACSPSSPTPCGGGYTCACSDSTCSSGSGTCVLLRFAGERCDEPNTQCHPAFSCTAGVCAPLDSQGLFAVCGTP
jgi:hypothetical protein